MTPKHFLNSRNRKNENRKNVEIPGNSVKNCHFRHSKCHKLVNFQNIDLKFCTHIQMIGFSQTYSCFFFENLKFSFENYESNRYYFPKKIIKISEIWDSSLIATFIFNLLLKTISFYLLSRLRGNVSRKPLFLPKIGKTWRYSDVICDWRIGGMEVYFCQDMSN